MNSEFGWLNCMQRAVFEANEIFDERFICGSSNSPDSNVIPAIGELTEAFTFKDVPMLPGKNSKITQKIGKIIMSTYF